MEYHVYPGNILQFDSTYYFRIILGKGIKKQVQIQEISASVEEECVTNQWCLAQHVWTLEISEFDLENRPFLYFKMYCDVF